MPQHRRRTDSSSTRSSSSRRSRSPLLTFTPTAVALPSDKGVHNITRKVIRRLEGLGHLEMLDVLPTPEEETDAPSSNVSEGDHDPDNEHTEVENALYAELIRQDRLLPNHPTTTNGHAPPINCVHASTGGTSNKKPVDWEIPRKLLHSSIGFLTLYLYISEGDVSTTVLVLWSSLCIIVPADLLRLRWPAFERLFERLLGFMMRESEKHSTNGVIWYILGVNFALQFYPKDVATVAILILSWADTAASTIGRLFGPSSPRLPSHLPILRIPLAPRKSLAGFIAASVTGTLIAVGFWAWIAPLRLGGQELSWAWDEGVRIGLSSSSTTGGFAKGWLGLGVIGVVAGFVSGVSEAMDLGSLDDNLTLPIVSGGCILGFLKFLGWIGSALTSVTS